MRQGTDRGIIGSGFATSGSFQDDHWNGVPGEKALYVEYQSDTLVHTEDRLPVERLLKEEPGVPWNNLYASGVQVPSESVHRLERVWTTHLVRLGRSVSGDTYVLQSATDAAASSVEGDAVERVLREIVQRRGQPDFRERLLAAYNRRCAVTGCDAIAALEAAHIRPYSGASSCRVTNGLLLRADIHSLFDLNLIGIDPRSLMIVLAQEIRHTSYKALNGKSLALPDDARSHPSKDALRERWSQFKETS